jgi:hypothetical protein
MSKHSEDDILPTNNHHNAAVVSPPLPDRNIRHEYPVFIGEFVGTFMFLFLSFAGTSIAIVSATVENTNSDTFDLSPIQTVSKLIYISFAFGVALAVNVSIFADISGAMFNPAVSSLLHSSQLNQSTLNSRTSARVTHCATRGAPVVQLARNVVRYMQQAPPRAIRFASIQLNYSPPPHTR